MQLSMHADYACRVLMFLATDQTGQSSVQNIARCFGISENHLVKVVHKLGKEGFLVTTRGRGGGIRLARKPDNIIIGDVIRRMEPNFTIVECFDTKANSFPLIQICQLKAALAKATVAFLSTLDAFTLADIVKNSNVLTKVMGRS